MTRIPGFVWALFLIATEMALLSGALIPNGGF